MIDELQKIKLFEPWAKCPGGLEKELRKEVATTHVLFGVEAISIARRIDNDDVLFYLPKYKNPFAVVHLTWSGRPEDNSVFPYTKLYTSLKDWTENCLKADNLEFNKNF